MGGYFNVSPSQSVLQNNKLVLSFTMPPPSHPLFHQFFFTNFRNFSESSMVHFIFFFNNVCRIGKVGWTLFPNATIRILRRAFITRIPQIAIEIDGCQCLVDFQRMVIIDQETGCVRSIGWVDNQWRYYYPSFPTDCGLCCGGINGFVTGLGHTAQFGASQRIQPRPTTRPEMDNRGHLENRPVIPDLNDDPPEE